MITYIKQKIKQYNFNRVSQVVRLEDTVRIVLLSQDEILHVDLLGNILVVLVFNKKTGKMLHSISELVPANDLASVRKTILALTQEI